MLRAYATYIDKDLCSVIVLVRSFNRWIILLSAKNEKGRKFNCQSYVLDQFIQERAGNNEILDFEGSNIPGIAHFNREFGASEKQYYTLKLNPVQRQKKLILHWFHSD